MFKTLWLSPPRPPPREGCRMASASNSCRGLLYAETCVPSHAQAPRRWPYCADDAGRLGVDDAIQPSIPPAGVTSAPSSRFRKTEHQSLHVNAPACLGCVPLGICSLSGLPVL
jgi:hypothetical protein